MVFLMHKTVLGQASPTRVALVLALTLGLALCTALLLLVARLCWTASLRPPSPRDTPSHLDLDNDAIDYDLACRQLNPLPEPRLMVGGEGREEWGIVSTLTRARGRQTVARLAPLEDYMGPPCEDNRAVRYSTIGRGRGGREGLTTPSPPPPCCQDEPPPSLPFQHSPRDLPPPSLPFQHSHSPRDLPSPSLPFQHSHSPRDLPSPSLASLHSHSPYY